jgi:hypothetical protein
MSTAHLDRVFEVAVKTPEGRASGTYATATCACGRSDDILVKRSAGGRVPTAEPYARRFRNRGWDVGNRIGGHTCPDCKGGTKADSKAAGAEADTKPAAAPKADPPPQARPDDRRRILEALDIVFTPEDGFDAGFDDASVAKELNVPRRWVEEVREQFIGPIPEPKVDHIAEARKLLTDLASAAVRLQNAIEQANAERSRIRALQADIDHMLKLAGGGK